jgi:hypothetical protein
MHEEFWYDNLIENFTWTSVKKIILLRQLLGRYVVRKKNG